MPEYKAVTHFTKAIDDRTVSGIFMVHGHIDDGLDRSHPGALADYKVDGRDRTRFLWSHDAGQPPVAVIKSIREIPRAELPPAVLAYAPDATGAAEVVREYLTTPRGEEILTAIKAGAIQEMSYAYELSGYSFTEDGDRTIRELTGIKLFDVSDVTHGMNNATLASKALDWKARPFIEHADAVEAALAEWCERVRELKDRRAKEGRVLSGENRKRIEAAVEALTGAHGALMDLLAATEPKQQQPPPDVRKLYLEYQRALATLNGVLP